MVPEDLPGSGDPVVDQGGRRLGRAILSAGGQRGNAKLLGIGVVYVGHERLACGGAQNEHKAVFFDGLDKGLDARQLDVAQQGDQLLVELGRDAAGAAVGDEPVLVNGAKVAPGGHILWLEVKTDAQRLQDPPADVVLQRVVAKQGQVGRTAARGDAGPHRHGQPQLGTACQGIEVGCDRRLQLGLAIKVAGESAEPIQHQVHDPGLGRDVQRFHQIEICHDHLSKKTMHNSQFAKRNGNCALSIALYYRFSGSLPPFRGQTCACCPC
jgi:hypothetical protein